MSQFKFELNKAGVKELLKSPEMMAICKEKAEGALGQLGTGYSVSAYTGKSRVNASVHADTYKARLDNSKNNSILKAVFSQ